MLTIADLTSTARARLRDATALLSRNRYDGAVYLCGYAVEIAIKARIVKTLRWSGFPELSKDFGGLTSFKSHDLEVLLHLSGWEPRI
jgi:HEPN domain-containing protein